MSTLDALLRAIVADPQNEDRCLVLTDFLDDYDDARRAEQEGQFVLWWGNDYRFGGSGECVAS